MEIEECNDSYQTLWFVPLNWAIILLKKAFNAKKLKDPKDLIKDIMKFHIDLRYILEHKNHKMPGVFSTVSITRVVISDIIFLICLSCFQAVWLAVIGWLIVTLVGAQNTDHYSDQNARATSAAGLIIFTVPGHEVSQTRYK